MLWRISGGPGFRTESRGMEHILYAYAVAPGGVVDENMSDGAYQLTVLYDGAAAHPLYDAPGKSCQAGICYG